MGQSPAGPDAANFALLPTLDAATANGVAASVAAASAWPPTRYAGGWAASGPRPSSTSTSLTARALAEARWSRSRHERTQRIWLSPDGTKLYVSETYTVRVWCWDVTAPGAVTGGRTVAGSGGANYVWGSGGTRTGQVHGRSALASAGFWAVRGNRSQRGRPRPVGPCIPAGTTPSTKPPPPPPTTSSARE